MLDEPNDIASLVTASDSPFALTTGAGMRRFAKAPSTLHAMIETAHRHGDAIAIVEGERRMSFAEFFTRRDALAGLLDIAPNTHVAICMQNCTEWMIGFAAIMRAGGVTVLINSRGSAEEIHTAIVDSNAAIVLADAKRCALIRGSAGGSGGCFAGRFITTDSFPATGMPPAEETAARAPKDACAILYTSGTTGRVKGALLTHENLVTGLMAMQMSGLMILHATARSLGVAVETIIANLPQQAVLQTYPLFHISGLGAAFLSPFCSGSKIVVMNRWEATAAMRLIEQEQITQFSAVPTMLWDVVQAAKHTKHAKRKTATAPLPDLSSLRNIGTGGQALPLNLLEAIRRLCPHAMMGTGYGLTETSGSVAIAVGEQFLRKREAAGQQLALVDMYIESADGKPLPHGQAGEIIVRGAMVMSEYWKQPEATAAVLDEEGWFHTGDIGYLDEEGYLFIVDRKKDMVISGGENIYCAEVERVLLEIPDIGEAACFGIPDARLGEALVAVVVAVQQASAVKQTVRDRGDVARGDRTLTRKAVGNPDSTLTSSEDVTLTSTAIQKILGTQLAKYKIPTQIICIDTALPRNHLGKIDKRTLRRTWSEIIQ